MKIRQPLLLLLLIMPVSMKAQNTGNRIIIHDSSVFTISGYGEIYYGFDFNRPVDNNRPGFIFSHNRHNEINVNLAFLKGSYKNKVVRANLAIATGTYMNANYASEPGVLKNIYEANAGIKLSPKYDLWLDAGIMQSHLGFESAQSANCMTLTRSIVAENSPYYESGLKLAYTTHNKKWLFAGLILNGWQRIQRPNGNSTIAGGTQITFSPANTLKLNYSTFVGNDKPDTARRMRVYHDIYASAEFNKVKVLAGFDFGTEQKAPNSNKWNNWFSPVLIARYKTGDKTAIALRIEYFNDKHGVVIMENSLHSFKTWGYSLNFDYVITRNLIWRTEAKVYSSKSAVFKKRDKQFNYYDPVLTTSVTFSF